MQCYIIFIQKQGRRKLFMVGVAEQKCRPQWLADNKKCPKAVPQKTTFEPKYK